MSWNLQIIHPSLSVVVLDAYSTRHLSLNAALLLHLHVTIFTGSFLKLVTTILQGLGGHLLFVVLACACYVHMLITQRKINVVFRYLMRLGFHTWSHFFRS